jgi:hypothetical protein
MKRSLLGWQIYPGDEVCSTYFSWGIIRRNGSLIHLCVIAMELTVYFPLSRFAQEPLHAIYQKVCRVRTKNPYSLTTLGYQMPVPMRLTY